MGLEHFTGWEKFGLIHVSSHGNTIFEDWQSQDLEEEVMPAWMKGQMSTVGISTGVVLPLADDGTLDISEFYEDIVAFRVVLMGRALVVTPAWFATYLGELPNSIIHLSACRSLANESLANVLLGKGAGAVFGFDDYVTHGYARNVAQELYAEMLADGSTIEEAYSAVISGQGVNDPGTGRQSPHATYLFRGNRKLKVGSEFRNGSFEDGLQGWDTHEISEPVVQLGEIEPVDGSVMAMIATGTRWTSSIGTIEQSFPIPSDATSLSFSWNLNTEEIPTCCTSAEQDNFKVELCEQVAVPELAEECRTLLYTEIKEWCGKTSPVEFRFQGFDPVQSTGWQSFQADISEYQGKCVTLRFSTGDPGLWGYHTAVLVDSVRVQ